MQILSHELWAHGYGASLGSRIPFKMPENEPDKFLEIAVRLNLKSFIFNYLAGE